MLGKQEDKITTKLKSRIENTKLKSRIENIVEKKCKAVFEEKKPMISKTATQTVLQIFQNKIFNIQSDIKALNNKSDHIIGSLTYMVCEYDDFAVKTANFASAK